MSLLTIEKRQKQTNKPKENAEIKKGQGLYPTLSVRDLIRDGKTTKKEVVSHLLGIYQLIPKVFNIRVLSKPILTK